MRQTIIISIGVLLMISVFTSCHKRDFKKATIQTIESLDKNKHNIFFVFESIEHPEELEIFLRNKDQDGMRCWIKNHNEDNGYPDSIFANEVRAGKEKFRLDYTPYQQSGIRCNQSINDVGVEYIKFTPIK